MVSVISSGSDNLEWWRHAVIYQIYIKSFADSDGDGVGDIGGLIAHVADIAAWGADAVWVCPWFESPMRDGGYDITDHRKIDPLFGDLASAERFIEECHRHGLRVLLDFVGNHVSRDHPWFLEALASEPGSDARRRFYFAPGRGEDEDQPPTDWPSIFGGSAWTRESASGEWFLHLFDSSQPDLNWRDEGVRSYVRDTFAFWFDRGVDGFRLDALPGMGKTGELVDAHLGTERFVPESSPEVPFWDQNLVHEVLGEWRSIARSYQPERFLVGEVVVNGATRERSYTRDAELPSLLAITLAKAQFRAESLAAAIRQVGEGLSEGAWSTWTVSSHDERRPVSRYAEGDLERGRRRSRAVHLLALALPGSVCVYQGDELALENVDDIPVDLLQDPIYERTGDRTLVRDGCRVPLPWSEGPAFGFSSGTPWLPQPLGWSALSRTRQVTDPHSTWSILREAVRSRRRLVPGDPDWSLGEPVPGVLELRRGEDFRCWVNCSHAGVPVPTGWRLLIASEPDVGEIPVDGAVWMERTLAPSTP